ncbi:MAG: tryptophan 7-halogenase [Anaerolineae bacterium]|nr:tryptophan 7-halogenase [Anaerolineae bacterium]
MPHYDVIIMGGGPAGATVGTLVKKYSPHLRVLLLEKAHFPRHHVGESLLAGASPVLNDMGVYDRINQYGFIEKSGATYVWGHDRQPWGFDFDRVVKPLLDRGIALPEMYSKGWQVRRSEYDYQLLLHAQEMGVEVRQGARVTHVRQDSTGSRVVGVDYRDEDGPASVDCTWLMDCTGQDALLGHALDNRQYSETMNNYALYGYWSGYQWHEQYMGHPRFTRIFLATSARGWFWCIPASDTVLSIGLVTNRQTLQSLKESSALDLYLSEIESCPEIMAILDGAQMTRLTPDQNRDLYVVQDWSYESTQKAGNGWAMAGDAAGFVDPILSSGVMIAHELGQKAAYAINSSFCATSDADIQRYWQFYEDTYRTYLHAYRQMAEFWYGNNFLMENWWWEAQRTINRTNALELNAGEAFMRLASGYAYRAESLSLFGSYPLEEAQQLVNGLFGVPYEAVDVRSQYAGKPLKLKANAQMGEGLYFFQGLVRKTRRVINSETQAYLDLHPAEEIVLRLLDGAHTLSDLDQVVSQIQAKQQRMPIRNGLDMLVQLDNLGVLA